MGATSKQAGEQRPETNEIATAFRAIRDELSHNALLSAELENRLVMQIAEPLGRIAAADLVITGEGALDWQSLQGKVVSGVAAAALQQARPPTVTFVVPELMDVIAVAMKTPGASPTTALVMGSTGS